MTPLGSANLAGMIVWAVALGWMVLGEVPDAFTLGGAAIIVAAGLYILWREQIVTRREPALAPLPPVRQEFFEDRWNIAGRSVFALRVSRVTSRPGLNARCRQISLLPV